MKLSPLVNKHFIYSHGTGNLKPRALMWESQSVCPVKVLQGTQYVLVCTNIIYFEICVICNFVFLRGKHSAHSIQEHLEPETLAVLLCKIEIACAFAQRSEFVS